MIRLAIMCAALCALAVPAAAASATGDSEQSVLADCGHSGLAASAVDSCLERARILDETTPSPQIESLIARIEVDPTGRSENPEPVASGIGHTAAEAAAISPSEASSSPRSLGASADETPASPAVGAEETLPPDAMMTDDDDMPPVDDAFPQASGSDEEGSPADDRDDDDGPPVDDAPNG